MSTSRRSGSGATVAHESNEIAQNTATASEARRHGPTSVGSIMTGLASTVALVFSAVSLYHSVLKQPQLEIHLPQVVHYTRDPNGNVEVFAIPLTVANHGARDGTIVDLELVAEALPRAKAEGDGEDAGELPPPKTFYAAYSVDGDFFVPPGRFNMQQRSFERVDRPKAPFAPIAVAGRSAFSGTLLFYTKGKAFPKLVSQAGEYRLTLKINTRLDSSLGWLDSMLATPPEPVTLDVGLSYFSESSVLKGGTHPLKSTEWSKEESAGE